MQRNTMWIGLTALLAAIIALAGISAATATQDSLPPDEADTENFIVNNFSLQDHYSRVLCVSGDDACPAEITTAVPTLIAAQNFAAQTYPIADTFATIQAAADAAQPGDLIIIMPGRYAGVAVEETGGADGAYIHLLGWGDPGSVIVDAPADPSKSYLRHHFYFIDAHHYIIQNIAFEGADDGAGVFVSGYFAGTGHFAHHFIILNIYSHDNGYWGLHTTATSTVLIQDSVFTTSRAEHGVYISGSGDDMVIRRNVFQDNAAGGLQVNADPQTATEELFWWLAESTGDTCGISEDDVWITEWQAVKDCYVTQGLPDLGAYIEDGISERLIIEQNIVTANGASGGGGINLAAVRHSTVRNNLIYGNFAAGIACWDNAYAEEKELPASDFGCDNVAILHNTIVDEAGDRGALILNQDARNMTVINNIIVRDRFDAYEITGRSGTGLISYANAYSAQVIDESPGWQTLDTDSDSGSITDFSVAEALDQFVAPGFAPWMQLDGAWPVLNPDRPDFHLRPDSAWASAASSILMQHDLFGEPRVGGHAFGALVPAVQSTHNAGYVGVFPSAPPEKPTWTLRQTDSVPPTITYRLAGDDYNGHIYRILAEPGAEPESLTLALDALAPRTGDPAINTVDEWANIAPDGEWLLVNTERFDPDCNGWPCLTLLPADLSHYEVIRAGGELIHAEEFSAISSGGDLIVYPGEGVHSTDLWAIRRVNEGWSDPLNLTADSPYEYNSLPALHESGLAVVFHCGPEPYGQDGTEICLVNTDKTGLRVIVPLDPMPTEGMGPGSALNHADFVYGSDIADPALVFEGDWGGELLWQITPGAAEPTLIDGAYTNDNSPCVLPNGRIASLWLNRPENPPGYHELKVMDPATGEHFMLVVDVDVLDTGLGCGGSMGGMGSMGSN